jgi:hypothetical protein
MTLSSKRCTACLRRTTRSYSSTGASSTLSTLRCLTLVALLTASGGIVQVRFADFYGAGLNDDHIDTALRKIFKPIIAEFEVDTPATDLRA